MIQTRTFLLSFVFFVFTFSVVVAQTAKSPVTNARWGLCWMNFQILIITISVIAGVIVIAIFVCCFCCCKCENIGRSKRSEERMENQASLRKFRHEERKAEMKQRHDEMRLKYGLKKDNQYSRFENS